MAASLLGSSRRAGSRPVSPRRWLRATEARSVYNAMASTRTPGCMDDVAATALQASMQEHAGSDTTVGAVSFTALPSGAGAHRETGFTVDIPVASSGREVLITSTQVDFVTGRLFHQVTFNGNGSTFPAQLEVQLLGIAQGRS